MKNLINNIENIDDYFQFLGNHFYNNSILVVSFYFYPINESDNRLNYDIIFSFFILNYQRFDVLTNLYPDFSNFFLICSFVISTGSNSTITLSVI